MNNLPIVLLQVANIAMTLAQDHHPRAEYWKHFTYWLAHRIGVTMDKKPEFSQFYNIIKKKEALVTTLQIIADTSNDDDSRSQARECLIDIGVIAPPAKQEALPHMPPMPDPPPLYGPFDHGPAEEVMSEPGFGTFGKLPDFDATQERESKPNGEPPQYGKDGDDAYTDH